MPVAGRRFTNRLLTGKDAMREAVEAARRVVVKVGSSSLTTAGGTIDEASVTRLVGVLAAEHAAGRQVVLVSSGAIAAGFGPLGLPRRPRDLATLQAAAGVGQGLLLARYARGFGRHGVTVGQVLLTAADMVRRAQHRNAQRVIEAMLARRTLPIVNENDAVATEEITFGDNDRLAALVAHLTGADALVLLSDVDALHDGDPRRSAGRVISDVRDFDELAGIRLGGTRGVGTGGMVTKVEAARIATAAGIPAVLAAAVDAGAALAGEPVGTYFHPATQRTARRLLWLAHATTACGSLTLDPGAVEAVLRRHASLLPAGVVGVTGDFSAGDPVDLCDEAGRTLARGLVNYDSVEVPALMGRSTRWLAGHRGRDYERELMHRDDMAILATGAAVTAGVREEGDR